MLLGAVRLAQVRLILPSIVEQMLLLPPLLVDLNQGILPRIVVHQLIGVLVVL
jgi:hypothetical protein